MRADNEAESANPLTGVPLMVMPFEDWTRLALT